MTESSLPVLVQQLASRLPDEAAYTFIDYQADPNGFAESLTWSQVHRRSLIVADELRMYGSTGDRAAIVAPQGLDYIVAFLGALQAGFIAVPLPAPEFGLRDDRVSSALQDSAPSVILTTSSIVCDVVEYISAMPGEHAPVVVEIDSLNFDLPPDVNSTQYPQPSIAYLQYTSGSTRRPAGVEISHRNVVANFRQAMSGYFGDYDNVPPPDTTIVSWLPFYHDMGLLMGNFPAGDGTARAVLMSPMSFLQRPARWMQLLGGNSHTFRPPRTSLSNWRRGERPTTTWRGWTSGMCSESSTAANTSMPGRSRASPSASLPLVSARRSCDRRTGSRRQPCTWHRPHRAGLPGSSASITRICQMVRQGLAETTRKPAPT